MKVNFEPKIVGFLCNWCAYSGADLAGVSRMKYPANLRIIRVMCSGRVEPALILKAFREGADGVLVAGCHPGDCHYMEGNYKALKRVKLLTHLLEQFGIEPERLRLEWISASEAEKLVRVVTEMVDLIRALGPLERTDDLLERVWALDKVAESRLASFRDVADGRRAAGE